MRNPRAAVAAFVLLSALAVPAGSGASSAAAPPPPARTARTAAVVVANSQVNEVIARLGVVGAPSAIHIVKVDHRSLGRLLEDRRFVQNVHALQGFVHENDAGALSGAGVAVADLLAVDLQRDGDVVIFTR